MRRIVSALLALAVLAALAVVTTTSKHAVRAVYAQGGCTDGTLSGNYGFHNGGFTSLTKSNTAREAPFAVVGVEAFDGAGNTSLSYTDVLDGKIFTNRTSSGTYTVNSDCTGSISLTSGSAAGFNANMVIIGGGAEVFGIPTNAGETAIFDEKKQ